MPCSSVATATARIDPKLMLEVLQSADAISAITAHLKAKGLNVIQATRLSNGTREWSLGNGARILMGEDGQLTVVHRNEAVADSLRTGLQPFVKRLGGLLLQEAVKAKIRAVAKIEGEAKTSGGAIVLSVSL